jgi:eukaryotic-like serine/threonine-protein kinase
MTRLDENLSVPVPEPGAQADGPTPDPDALSMNSSLETAAPPPSRDGADFRPTFGPGALVAGRYRIVRFLAQGGMGQVYEARDLELGEPVALKTLRPEIAQSEQAVEFFKREIQLARKVTHRSVCRIFDIGRHRLEPETPDAPQGDVLFFTMELLEGESLRQRLQRTGPMRPSEALGIILQMADALRAAHAAGVVHRDFKSQNVVLVRKDGSLRVVVTDFGLACPSTLWHGPSSRPAGTEAMIGTPAYMAPEQVEGKELRPATDVYSFGVVLYEMLTGQLPFAGATALETAVQRLKQDPAPPRKHVPDLPERWERTILRCLERNPRDRFRGASEAVQMLLGEDLNRMDRPRPKPQARSRVPALLAVLGVLAAGVAALQLDGRWTLRDPEARAPAAVAAAASPVPVRLRRSVAILGFKNLSGRPEVAWIGEALAEMLRNELGAEEHLRVLPNESVAQMKTQLGLSEADSYSEATLGRIRALLGADLVVLGAYLAFGEHDASEIRLDLSLQDTRTGDTIAAVTETGSERELAEHISRVGQRLREKVAAARF